MSLKGSIPWVKVNGRTLDPKTVVTPLVVTCGRATPDTQPNANGMGVELLGDLPEEVILHAPVVVFLAYGQGGYWGGWGRQEDDADVALGSDIWMDQWSPDDPSLPEDPEEWGTTITRFTGRITDIIPRSEGGVLFTDLTCVGRKADLGQIRLGGAAWAAETEEERLQRIADNSAAYGANIDWTAYAWTHASIAKGRRSALDQIHQTAGAAGLVRETPEGQVIYEAWDFRKGQEPSMELTPLDIMDNVGWSQGVARIAQRVVVNYGPSDARQDVVVGGPDGPGVVTVTVESPLDTLEDATALGNLIISRWGKTSQWEAPEIEVPASILEESTWDALMGVDVSQVIFTDGITPEPNPLPYGGAEWFVEGWREEWDRAGNGPILQTNRLALSDRQRFAPDAGVATQVLDIKVTPNSAKYGTDRTIAGRVAVDADGSAVEDGVVVATSPKGAVLGETTVDINGDWSILVDGGDLSPGEYALQINYLGIWGTYLKSEAESDFMEVTQPDTSPGEVRAMVSLGINPSRTVKVGSGVRLTTSAELTDGTRNPSGEFTFQVSRNNGGSWNTFATRRADAGGGAGATWTSTRPDDPTRFRVIFDAARSGVSNVTSSSKSIDVLGKTTKTITYHSSWSASYKANGDKRGDVGTDLYQGWVSSTNGDQRSLAGFGIDPDSWKGWTITKVEVRLKFTKFWKSSGGTALIGSHSHGSEPNANPKVNPRKSKVKWKNGEAKWVNITGWAKGLASGNIKGICLGPANSTATEFYAWAVGGGDQRPQVRITGYRWQ